MSPPPFARLRYLYVGTGNFDEDLRYYHEGVGASIVWNRQAYGARVAALRLADGPLLLIADHRPAPSCMPVYEVGSAKETAKALRDRGCKPTSGPFEIPNGPCYVYEDKSGNPFAVFEDQRPNLLGDESTANDPAERTPTGRRVRRKARE